MKKIWLLLCLIVSLICTGIPVHAEPENPSLTVGHVSTENGEIVEVPVCIANNTGICGAIISIDYDEKLELTGVAGGDAFSSMTFTKPGDLSANPVNLVWDSTDADYSNGTIAVLSFKAPDEDGDYSVSASYGEGDIIDNDLNPVEVSVNNGGINVQKTEEKPEESIMINVNATAYNKLTLTWNEISSADGYVIYRSSSENGTYSTLKTLEGASSTSYINTVTSGVTYYYRIKSYCLDESGNKIYSEFSEAVSGKALPAAPTIQSTVMTAYNKICISWTKVNGCEGYVIYRSTSENGTYSVMKTVTQATATSYTNMVTSSEDYYYKIRAYVLVDEKKVYGEYSNISMGNVITGPPAEFDGTVVSATKLKFTWSKVEDADGYVIYMSSSEDAGYKAVKNITSKDTLTYSKTLSSTAPYYYKMRAYRLIDGKKVYSDYTETIER
ncbi:MAG: fibronectin type III domain-containing protein [Lachnospiraceae bacterium]